MSGGENYPDLQNIERSGVYQFNSGLWLVRILWRPKGTNPNHLDNDLTLSYGGASVGD